MQYAFRDELSDIGLTQNKSKRQYARYKPPPGSRKSFVEHRKKFTQSLSKWDDWTNLFSLLGVMPEQFYEKSTVKGPCEWLCYRLLEDALNTVFNGIKKQRTRSIYRNSKLQADIDWLLGNPIALSEDLCISCERCCIALGIDFDYFRQEMQKTLEKTKEMRELDAN